MIKLAMIDYGSVVKKNGKIIQTETFMNMKKAVGFTIKEIPYDYYGYDWKTKTNKMLTSNEKIEGQYFSYIGDKDLLICIYKGILLFISNNKIIKIVRDLWLDYDLPYTLQQRKFTINNVNFKIKRLFNNNRYELRFWYKGDLYECLYGYGVDVDKDMWYYDSEKEKRYVTNWFKES